MDKKISQLNIRPLLADTDVFPVVASGSTETNKATLLNLRNNYLFPVISGNAGRFLTTDGTSIFWDVPPVATLDQVLTAGNVSNKEIILNGGINGDLVVDGNDMFVGGVPTFLIRNLTTNQNHRLLIDRSIFNNNGNQLDIVAPTLTGSRVLTYPNASGTFAISVNGFTPNSSGNITLPGIGSFGLNDLTDVTIVSPANDQILVFDSVSGQWQNEAIPNAPIPNLQEVTDAGNVSTNNIQLDNGNQLAILAPEKISTEGQGGTYSFIDSGGFLGLNAGTGNGSIESRLQNTNVTSPDVVLEFPNKPGGDYTIATTDDLTSFATNLNGLSDVTISSPANGDVLIFDSVSGQWENVPNPGTTIPTLQEVIDAGNESTTTPIFNVVAFREQNNPSTLYSIAATDGAFEGAAGSDKLFGFDTDAGLNLYGQTNQFGIRIAPLNSVVTSKSFRLPNIPTTEKTFVFSVNGVDADGTGDVVLPVGATTLDELNDVTITTPADGDVLTFDSVSGEWQNQASTIPSLQDVTNVGNTTTNDIFIQENGNNVVSIENISPSPSSPLGRITIRGLNDYLQFNNSNFAFQHFSGQTNVGYYAGTGTNNLNFPNNSGTLLVEVNGQTSGSTAGSIQIGLDSVLENGSFSDNSITLQDVVGSATNETIHSPSGFRAINNFAQIETQVSPNIINFVRTIGSSTFSTQLKADETDAAPGLLTLPRGSGTLVKSVNGTSPDVNGNVVVPGGGGATTLDGLTDVTIATPTNGQGLIFDSVSGQWQNQTIPGTSTPTLQEVTTAGNTTTDDIVLNDAAITGIDFLDFDLTPSTSTNQEGRVQWNDDLKTLQIDTENAGVQINVGHETIQRVRNVSGSTIQKGKICFINGASGNRPTIQLSDNSTDPLSAQTIGFVAADIANNSNGYLITNGLLEDISTIGFATGTQLFLSSNGDFQSTFPTQPLHNVRVGIVIVGNSANGSIFVNILNGYEIEELHDVLITSPANDQVLTFETSSGLWKNKAIPAPSTPTLQQVTSAGNLTTNNIIVDSATFTTTIIPGVIAAKVDATNAETQIAGNDIRFIRGGFQTNLKANDSVPAVGTLILPNGSGTLVKSVNGNSPDINGDVVVSGGGGATTLNDLTDVTIASPVNNESLVYNSTSGQWQNTKVGLPWTIDFGFTSFNLQASETYVTGLYYGAQPSTLINNRPSRKAIIQKTGFLKNVQILTAMSSAASSGNMILTFINETQGTSQVISSTFNISSISLSSLSRLDLFQGFNFAVNVGDVVQMRIQTPAWSTLPTGVSMQFVTLFES